MTTIQERELSSPPRLRHRDASSKGVFGRRLNAEDSIRLSKSGARIPCCLAAERDKRRMPLGYVIGIGIEHPPLAALGYVEAAAELLEQFAGAGLAMDTVVLTTATSVSPV